MRRGQQGSGRGAARARAAQCNAGVRRQLPPIRVWLVHILVTEPAEPTPCAHDVCVWGRGFMAAARVCRCVVVCSSVCGNASQTRGMLTPRGRWEVCGEACNCACSKDRGCCNSQEDPPCCGQFFVPKSVSLECSNGKKQKDSGLPRGRGRCRTRARSQPVRVPFPDRTDTVRGNAIKNHNKVGCVIGV